MLHCPLLSCEKWKKSLRALFWRKVQKHHYSTKKTLNPPISAIKNFFQKLGFVSFLIILFSVIVQKINEILRAVLKLWRFWRTGLITWNLHFMGPIKQGILRCKNYISYAVCTPVITVYENKQEVNDAHLKRTWLSRFLPVTDNLRIIW